MWKDEQGNTWYRGNLHAHTQRSDGRLSYEDMVSLYRDAGYDFVAATDHWVWSETEESQDFLLLAGCEYDVGLKVQEGVYHIVGIECEKAPDLVRRAPGLTAQKIMVPEPGGSRPEAPRHRRRGDLQHLFRGSLERPALLRGFCGYDGRRREVSPLYGGR